MFWLNEWINGTCLCSKLETKIQQLHYEQSNIKSQNQQLQSLNIQLQEQVESSREQLQAALGQLSVLELDAAQEQVARQRRVTNNTHYMLSMPQQIPDIKNVIILAPSSVWSMMKYVFSNSFITKVETVF